jgi:hypothetical protein
VPLHKPPPKATHEAPVEIDEWLIALGFTSADSRAAARLLLEAAKFTNPRKRAMSLEKLPGATAMLAEQTALACGKPCAAFAARAKARAIILDCEPSACSVCRGSNNRRAAIAMAAACLQANLHRILVVGGGKGALRELRSLMENTCVAFRCIDGLEETPNKKDAIADLNWAQLMIVWASTPLPHKVSTSYTDERPADLPMITVARRGVEALCREVVRNLTHG